MKLLLSKRVTAALLAAVSFFATSGLALAQVNPLDFVQIVPITDNNPGTNELGRDRVSINSTSFKNHSLFTVGDFQFTPYYRDDGKLLIARRDLTAPNNSWDIRTTEFTSFNINDAHNVAAFGIDGDGYLHVSWGMHAHDLLYTKSTTPVTNANPMSFVGDTVGNSGAINTMTGSHETRVTYPNFLNVPGSDDLLFNYRTGGSGNGEYRISRYDAETGVWSFVDELWISRTDTSGLTYNAYPHNMTYDSSGGLHASWTFRYNSSSPTGTSGFQTNHNLMYAYSPDNGTTWYRDVEGTVAYAGAIDDQTSEVIVPIPEGSSLINTGTQAIDGNDRPAIATWWAPHANDPTPDHRRQYMYVGHDGTDWFTSQITHKRSDNSATPIPESSLGSNHMGRPQIVFDDYNRAYVVFKAADRGGVVTVAVSQAESRDDWELIDLTSSDLGRSEPTIDLALWEQSRRLHVLTQTIDGNSSNGGSQMEIIEWDTAAAMGRVLEWTGAASAVWNATDVNFTDLETPDAFERFDNVTFDDSGAEKNVQLNGAVAAGKVVVDSTQAYSFTGPGGLASGSLSIVGGGSLELATSGNTYAGPTRVSHATLTITGDANAMTSEIIAADGGRVVMDPTDAAAMASSFTVWPTGVLDIGTATSTGNVFPDNSVNIVNDGLIRVNATETVRNMTGMGVVESTAGATTTLQNNSTFSGLVRVKPSSTVVAATLDGLGSGQGRLVVESGGQLKIAAAGTVWHELSVAGDGGGAGAVQIGGGLNVTFADSVTLDGGDASFDVAVGAVGTTSDGVSGPGGLVKQGGGTLRLAGSNAYAGTTVVRAGRLVVDSQTGMGDTLVEAGGVLEGGGLVRGNLTAQSGGVVRVAPVNAPGNGIVYEERFSGSGSSPLNGKAPDTVASGEFWTAHSDILDNGVGVSVSLGSSATLPLSVEDGSVYTLDATLLNVTGDSDWLAIGFIENVLDIGSASNGGRFISDPTTGKAWMLFRGDNSGGPNQTQLGNETSGTASSAPWPTLNDSGGDIHVRVVLDTTGGAGNYTAEFLARAVTATEYQSLVGPVGLLAEDVGAVGFAVSNDEVSGDVDFFRLNVDRGLPVNPKAMLVEGDFTLSPGATLELDLFDAANYDVLEVANTFQANGSLQVTLADGAPPLAAADAFDLLDFGSLTGGFELLLLPTLGPGLVWDNSQLLSDGIVQVVAGLPGDYNGDNLVDAADYTVWRNNLGTTGAGLAADGNRDLRVDQADYLLWRSNYGNALAAANATAVKTPEPSAVVALLLLLTPLMSRLSDNQRRLDSSLIPKAPATSE